MTEIQKQQELSEIRNLLAAILAELREINTRLVASQGQPPNTPYPFYPTWPQQPSTTGHPCTPGGTA